MKAKATLKLAIGAAAILVSGCAITQNVRPVTSPDIQLLCIHRNPEVFMSEFVTVLKSQIEELGIKARIYEGTQPPECRYRLEYVANWRWDLAMYLAFTDLRVYDKDLLIGEANYDARAGGGRPDKFGATAPKLKELVNQLFARR
jgi:hypothetical protein